MKENKKSSKNIFLFVGLRIITLIIAMTIIRFIPNNISIIIIAYVIYIPLAFIPNFLIKLEDPDYFKIELFVIAIVSIILFLTLIIYSIINYDRYTFNILFMLLMLLIPIGCFFILPINLIIDKLFKKIKNKTQKNKDL